MNGLEKLDFFTDKSLVNDPYDYYDAIRGCPVWREPAHGVVMVSGYDEAVAMQRDADQNFSVCNIVSGPWSGIPTETGSDDISDLIEGHRHTVPLSDYFVSFDPPKHTAHRSLLNRLFTPRPTTSPSTTPMKPPTPWSTHSSKSVVLQDFPADLLLLKRRCLWPRRSVSR